MAPQGRLPRVALLVALSAILCIGTVSSLSSCGGSCRSNNDCAGVLACFGGKCNDDPDVGSHVCSSKSSPPPPKTMPKPSPPPPPPKKTSPPPPTLNPTPSPSPPSQCLSSGTLIGPPTNPYCNTMRNSDCCVAGQAYKKYTCSPQVSKSTAATMTQNGFGSGEDGGGPSECDNQFHSDTELIVALSTGWYNSGSRCGKYINIKASNGKNVNAKVVDECDSRNGCDKDHAGQPPCQNNIVDASDAVWAALGIPSSSPDYGYMSITWSDV